MNDADRQLIEQVLKTAGSAGVQGWGYLVKYMLIDAVLSCIGWIGLLVVAVWLLRRIWAWKPRVADEGGVVRVFGIVLLFGVIFGFVWGLESSLAQAIMPQGAAISEALHRHG